MRLWAKRDHCFEVGKHGFIEPNKLHRATCFTVSIGWQAKKHRSQPRLASSIHACSGSLTAKHPSSARFTPETGPCLTDEQLRSRPQTHFTWRLATSAVVAHRGHMKGMTLLAMPDRPGFGVSRLRATTAPAQRYVDPKSWPGAPWSQCRLRSDSDIGILAACFRSGTNGEGVWIR